MKGRSVPIEIEIRKGLTTALNTDAIVVVRSKRLPWLAKLVFDLCGSSNVVFVNDRQAGNRAWKLFGLHEQAEP